MTTEHLYHGELISESGLALVAKALTGCSWCIELRHSGYDGTFYLRTPHTQGEIDLEMASGQSHRFLFSGGVDGSTERALSLLGDFSRCLTVGSFIHRVEVYDDADTLVGYFHHRWPQEHHEPGGASRNSLDCMGLRPFNVDEIAEVHRKIDAVLLRDWDPIGVRDVPQAEDEYRGYTRGIFDVAVRTRSAEAVARHLFSIERDAMGLSCGSGDRLIPVAQKILELVSQIGPVP